MEEEILFLFQGIEIPLHFNNLGLLVFDPLLQIANFLQILRLPPLGFVQHGFPLVDELVLLAQNLAEVLHLALQFHLLVVDEIVRAVLHQLAGVLPHFRGYWFGIVVLNSLIKKLLIFFNFLFFAYWQS